jgi:hypothetical protein
MSSVDAWSYSTRVVFDGQSLNVIPAPPDNYPAQLMAGRGWPFTNVAISGISWTVLQMSITERTLKYGAIPGQAILVMTGGTTDLGAEGDTGATVYAQMGAYANLCRAAGFDRILVNTITPSKALITDLGAGHETARTDCNTLLKADASHFFDAVIDIASDSRLNDYTNATYYEQVFHTHWTPAGAAVTASLVNPVLTPMLN